MTTYSEADVVQRDTRPEFEFGHPGHPATGRRKRSKTQRAVRRLKRNRPNGTPLKSWMRQLAGKGHADDDKRDARGWLARKGVR